MPDDAPPLHEQTASVLVVDDSRVSAAKLAMAMRALGHPDVFLPTDLAVRKVLAGLGGGADDVERWRPWRSYALMHLWNPLMPPTPTPDDHPAAAPRPAKET